MNSVIMNSHSVDQARRYADFIVGLREGHVVFMGTPEALTPGTLKTIYGDEVA